MSSLVQGFLMNCHKIIMAYGELFSIKTLSVEQIRGVFDDN